MSAIKKYLLDELKARMFYLGHSHQCDFYLSAWQRSRSAAPLLAVRTMLFLASLSITVTSVVHYASDDLFGFWFIYLTHWGLVVMTVTLGFATAVSSRFFFCGPLDADSQRQLPWYIKTYWVLYNTAVPIAFLITIFYWTVLYKADDSSPDDELNRVNVAVHGLNSVVMWLLLTTSSQPFRLLHVAHPLIFALTFFLFSLFYYLAGGINAKGEPWIYHVIDWKRPGPTIGVGALTGLLLTLIYFVVIGISLARDAVAGKYDNVTPANTREINDTTPLREFSNINSYV